jgi:glucosamine--fructose-6-phosphate aminotransferase (isomerizing)
MCGIVGYLGTREATPILLDCLKRLEYRGYDSAGIGLMLPSGLEIHRSTERLSGLEHKLNGLNGHALAARVGIGHTRWATHGRPTEQNAHPHTSHDGKVVVVHNGIFENFVELRSELSSYGLAPVTQTDTECFPLLVSLLMREGYDFEQAFRAATRRVEGKFAIACLHADHPEKILLARSGPTLVVGVGENEYFIASDVAPLLPHTRNVMFLEDGDVAVVTPEGVSITNDDEVSCVREISRVNLDASATELDGHEHFMHKEIYEQPQALARTLVAHLERDDLKLGLPVTAESWRDAERLSILACGTSWHAGLVGKFLIEKLARLPVEVDYASEYRYRGPIVSEKTIALAITQSGETADTLGALAEAGTLGARTLAICNARGSQITRLAQGTLFTEAGPEIGVASTKAFTTQVLLLTLLALEAGLARGTLGRERSDELLAGLRALPAQVERVVALEPRIAEVAAAWYGAHDALYLGRGPLYPIALEGALKLKEISYIHAEGYPAGELKHGPIALIDARMPIVALMPRDEHRERTLSNLQETIAREGHVIAFVTRGDMALEGLADALFELPETHPLLAPILYAIPLQLLAYHIAVLRGCDVDRPRNLAKSVTVE